MYYTLIEQPISSITPIITLAIARVIIAIIALAIASLITPIITLAIARVIIAIIALAVARAIIDSNRTRYRSSDYWCNHTSCRSSNY